MSPLNIHPEENVTSPKKKNNKMLKVMIGIGVLVLVPVIGTTLAGNIGIDGSGANGSGAAVFGQGVRSAVACDDDVLLKASARYVYGGYKLDTITVENLDGSACEGATIEISTAGNGQTDTDELGLIDLASPVARASATLADPLAANLGCASDFACTFSSNTLTVIIDNASGVYGVNALDVYNLLIQQL
jgi:hypothetical protein